MKKFFITFIIMVLSMPFAYADPISSDMVPPTPQSNFNHGTGAATPIDDYSMVLVILGILIASGIYIYRNNFQLKIK